MKKSLFAASGIFLVIVFFSRFAGAQTTHSLKLTDGTELPVVVRRYDNQMPVGQKITSFRIVRREAIVKFSGGNKAGYQVFPGKVPRAALRKYKKLFNQINQVTTSYLLKQENEEVEVDGFETINFAALKGCNPCQAKVGLVILEFTTADKIYYTPYVKSVKKLGTEQ